MKYYGAIKGDKLLIHTITWMNFKMCNTKWKKPDSKAFWFHSHDILQKRLLQGWKTDQWLPEARREGEGLTTQVHKELFWAIKLFYILIMVVVIWLCLSKLVEIKYKEWILLYVNYTLIFKEEIQNKVGL